MNEVTSDVLAKLEESLKSIEAIKEKAGSNAAVVIENMNFIR